MRVANKRMNGKKSTESISQLKEFKKDYSILFSHFLSLIIALHSHYMMSRKKDFYLYRTHTH
jgi:hypothetical protein